MNSGFNTTVGGVLVINMDGSLSLSGDVDADNLSLSGNITLEGGGQVNTTSNGDITLIPNGTGYTKIGDAGSPSRLTAGGDSLFVSNQLEVDGASWFDNVAFMSEISLKDNSILHIGDRDTGIDGAILWSTGQTPDTMLCLVGTESRSIVVAERTDIGTDFAHPQQTDPRIFVQSSDATDVSQYIGIGHNQTNAVIESGSGNIEINAPVRGATSLWYSYRQLSFSSLAPGGSGATFTAPNANTVGGYRLNASGEYLYADVDVHDDWDGVSDIEVEVYFETNAAGGSGTDTVDLQLLAYMKGTGDTSTKLQTLENAVTVGTAAQYTSFETTFLIDYDDVSNPVDVGDIITLRLNLETDTSEVDDVIINHIEVRYKSKQPAQEV